MGRLVPLAIALLVVLAPARTARAQAPDLSGRWTLIPEKAGDGAQAARVPATAGSGWGREFTIAQEGARLTIERAQFSEYDMQPPMRFVFALDGSESRNVLNMGRGPQEQVSRAAWQGGSLSITTRHGTGGPNAVDVTQVFSIDASGILVVDTTRRSPDGGVSTTKSRYQKR